MIVDCHAHFEPRMLDMGEALAKMDAAGVDRVVLIPAMNEPLPHTPELLLALVRRLLRSSVTRPLAERIHRATLTRDGHLRLGRTRVRIYPQPDNGSVAAAVAAHPDRFRGWIFLNPRADPDPIGTLERWRNVGGFVGVKLHPHWHDYPTRILGPILAHCEHLGLPVLIHLGFGARGDFRAMAQAHPRLPIIAAHAGFPWFRDLWRWRHAHRNVHVDLSSPYLDERLVRETVAAMGPERCLYGTDAPYGFAGDDGYDYDAIKGWVARLPIAAAKKDAIFGENFRRLVDL